MPHLAVLVPLVIGLSTLAGCVADPPPIIGSAVAGDGQATVSWQAPLAAPAPITAYVVTPWIGQVAQTPARFNSTATTETLTGLTDGAKYTFTVAAINTLGNDSASSGSSNPVTPGLVANAIVGGAGDTCAIVAGGAVDCWGSNLVGEWGNGTTTGSSTPVAIPALAGDMSLTSGAVASHFCEIVAGGAVDCQGWNFYGQLGNGTTTDSSTPVAVTGISGATAIAAGGNHTCTVRFATHVSCWGQNSEGELGNGTTSNSTTPVAVGGMSGATAVAAGYSHTCALLTGGTVDCWGAGGDGELGNGTTNNSISPVLVSGMSGATAIAAGDISTCALVGGAVDCWGGGGPTTPVPVSGISGATAIAAGAHHTCALLTGGAVDCWGANAKGQLGNGTTTDSSTPVAVSGISGATAIAAGQDHTCALLTGGTIQCWGWNQFGQLGNATLTDSSTPVTVI